MVALLVAVHVAVTRCPGPAAEQAVHGSWPVALKFVPATHGVLTAAHCGVLDGAQAQEPETH